MATGLLAQTALAYDHTHSELAAVLDGAVTSEGVDYDLIASRKATLDAYLKANADANAKTFTDDQKLAFYANSYNALTVNLIVTKNKPASIRDLSGGKVWDELSFPVGREMLSLNQIEHGKVRKLTDGRAHAIVNCASKGCPPLPPTPILASQVQADLDQGAKRWVATNAFSLDGSVLKLSKIFNWYAVDFTGMPKGTAGDEDMQKAGVAFIQKYGGTLGEYRSIEWADYDWTLNSK